MRRFPLSSSLGLLGSMILAACLGGTDLVPSSTGGTTSATTSTGAAGGTTTSMSTSSTTTTSHSGSTTSSSTTTGMGGSGGMTTSSSTGTAGGGTTSSTTTTGTGGGTTTTSSSSSSSGMGGGGVVGDPPCDVLVYFERKCWNCHGTTPHSESGLRLVTIQDLTAISDEDPTLTNAQRSIITMQDPLDPMPPGVSPWATPAEIASLQAWIDAGYPPSTCGDLAIDPYGVPPKCTSGIQIDPNGEEGEEMNPGWACNACHAQQNAETGADAPIYAFAGTIYPSAHEPDNCAGGGVEGAEIEVVDANGVVHIVVANAVGNFFFEDDTHTFKYPYKVRVVFQGRERWMDTPETDADCNKCHTPAGTDDAPGRILLP